MARLPALEELPLALLLLELALHARLAVLHQARRLLGVDAHEARPLPPAAAPLVQLEDVEEALLVQLVDDAVQLLYVTRERHTDVKESRSIQQNVC